MAVKLKIFLKDIGFQGENIIIMKNPLKDFLAYNIPEAIKINDLKEVDFSNSDFVAVLYNNTPLCDVNFLNEKCTEMQTLNIDKYLIGDGYLKNVKCNNGIVLPLQDPKTIKISFYRDLTEMNAYLNKKALNDLLTQNIFIMDTNTTFIESTVKIGEGSIIYPMVTLKGDTIIGENVIVFPYNYLEDTVIGDNTEVHSSFSTGAVVGKNCTVGPFATLRKGTVIGDFCRIGDYVEIKKSIIKDHVKVSHLAYIGDSFVDSNTNVGCGAVFANYDGKQKRSVTVGKNVFIGANTNLVAPLTIGDNVFIAAGSTVTKDLVDDCFCIARSRETIKNDYNKNIS